MTETDDFFDFYAQPKRVDLPGGKTVWLRPLTAGEATVFAEEEDEHGNHGRVAKAIIMSAQTEDGQPRFTDDDYLRVIKLPAKVFNKLANAVMALNGFTEDGPAAPKND